MLKKTSDQNNKYDDNKLKDKLNNNTETISNGED